MFLRHGCARVGRSASADVTGAHGEPGSVVSVSARTDRAATSVKRFALPVVLAIQVAVVLVQRPNLGGDDPVRAGMVDQLSRGDWPDIHFSVIHPLVVVPLYRLAQGVGHERWVVERSGLLLWIAWSVWMSTRLTRLRSLRVALLFQIFAFCSMLSVYLVGFNTEFFSALVVSAGLLAALTEPSVYGRACGWTLVVLGVANVPAQIPGLVAVSVVLAMRRRSIAPIVASVATIVISVGEASYSVGHFALSKYSSSEGAISPLLPWGNVVGFNHPLIFGVIGILFSLGRGLVFYIPAMWLALRGLGDDLRDWATCLAVFVLALVPLYAKWWAWYGGVTFGPRFFLLGCVPGAFVLAEGFANLRSFGPARRAVLLAVTALSAWVAVSGVVFYLTPGSIARCFTDNYRDEPLCWYSAEYSSLLAPLWDHQHISGRGMIFAMAVAVMVVAATAGQLKSVRGTWLSLRGSSPLRAAVDYVRRGAD